MPTALTNAERTRSTAANGRVWSEPNPRRVRVFFNSEAIADSTRSIYLFERDQLPVYYFPRADVRFDLLTATDRSSHCPWKGDAEYWSIAVGGRTAENVVWGYPRPLDDALDLSGFVAFYWDRVDAWYEEDDEVFVHPRDPYKRIDVLQSSRHVQILVGDTVVADTTRPRLLFETGLPTRYYIPKLDVRWDVLESSPTQTRCPYKGIASYHSYRSGDERIDDVAWIYPLAIAEIPKVENHVAFFNERVRTIVDGVEQPVPQTTWS
jgi:uncharacterized protein (DUF427 family)